LVVTNEDPLRRNIKSSLLRFGYDVSTTTASASAALRAVETLHPDLVLMDVCLDEADDGIAAAAAIHARHPTPIVFLSSGSDDATLMRAQKEAQPHGYVQAPYQDGELRAAVEVALQRHTLELEMRQQRSLLAGVLSGMSDAVIAADIEGNVVLVNEAGRRAFGEKATVDGAPDGNPRIYLADRETLCPTEDLPLVRALRAETVRDFEIFVRAAHGSEGRWYSVNATPLFDTEGLVCGAVAVGRDVTDLRAVRSELLQLSETDPLTGAYNRRGFMQVARSALESSHRSGGQPAVFFIDLNGMKGINDSLGHPEGDRLLMDVSSILRSCFRPSDVIGRLGGDEFVVLAADTGEHGDVLRSRLRAAVDAFNTGSDRSYRISISVGLCTADAAGPTALEDLVEQADKRMYEDKLTRGSRPRGGPQDPPVPRATTSNGSKKRTHGSSRSKRTH
jgi:diguanylate cyclase (GGDEF)-like protein/PAS domain S-box-containing protein